MRCPDGHFRRVIFGIGPVISDYPEQVLQAGIVQGWCPKCTALPQDLDNREDAVPRTREYTDGLVHLYADDPEFLRDMFGIDSTVVPFTNDFPLADIHEILSPDLLHQVIKGTFKDHLVEWVLQYLVQEHGKARGEAIMDIIDQRIAAVPPFPGLRHFPQGRRFKQWTGDDSKALMKVYLPVLLDYVPLEVLNTFSSFLDFCYLARRTRFNETTLADLDTRLRDFQEHREIFRTEGVRTNFSLPRQHALTHYRYSIQRFGAPYGLCSSITESRHITAVKKPWRRSNRYNALGQMLLTNQRLDKLQALRTQLVARGLLTPTHDKPPPKPTTTLDDDDNDAAAVDDMVQGSVVLAKRKSTLYPDDLDTLATFIGIPNLPLLTQRLLYDQLHPSSFLRAEDVPDNDLPEIYSSISVFPSAVATFYAPSDLSAGVAKVLDMTVLLSLRMNHSLAYWE
ncbi:hypothetical protein ONZ45_g13058 [Pleurotus djamor]|nr:hypothetical protein ONZ45_g13058 [Pleurotus djamor]